MRPLTPLLLLICTACSASYDLSKCQSDPPGEHITEDIHEVAGDDTGTGRGDDTGWGPGDDTGEGPGEGRCCCSGASPGELALGAALPLGLSLLAADGAACCVCERP